MIKNIQFKSLVMVLLFSNLMGAENQPKRPSFLGKMSNYTKNIFFQPYASVNSISSTLFGVDDRHPVAAVEVGIYATGLVIGMGGLITGNRHLMEVGACCAIIIPNVPRLVASDWRSKDFLREDTLFSRSAGALSLAGAIWFLKRNL